MRQWIAVFLCLGLILGLSGCRTQTPVDTQSIPETKEMATAALTEATVLEETKQKENGFLFLTVSELTFSVAGEQEDIYIGSIPRELVEWTSEDPAVVTVEDGVLTAVGAGTTRVTGTYGEQRVNCVASCLADTEEELQVLDWHILRSPKRMPFQVADWPQSFYDNSAFVGDSITYTLWHTAGKKPEELLNVLWLVRGGTSLNGFVRNYKNIFYKGQERRLDDAIGESGVRKVFLMMGQNDLGYMTVEDTMDNWDKLLARIFEQSPDVEIYIQSLIPEWIDSGKDNSKNDKIDQYNLKLKKYCQEKGYHFIEIANYIKDHTNRMATVYSMDQSIHINYEGTAVWMDVLKAYAKLQELQGETT